ncbi:MAG: selenium-dependent molybdenum cofactor biosynthesis protein YqeB [Bacillota bacterium]
MMDVTVIIKGAGDLASGTAHRMFRCGFKVIMLETSKPTVIRRTVSFAEAVYQGQATVEGVSAVLAEHPQEISKILASGRIPVVVDPGWSCVKSFKPGVVVDAIIAKKNLGTGINESPVVIGLGPGFTAGIDVHAVVETKRGHNLGRVILSGSAAPDTGIPGNIAGYSSERLLRSPARGVFNALKEIGDYVNKGDTVANVDGVPVYTAVSGVLRGILKNGLCVSEGMKVGDIDPRGIRESCFTISDKSRSVAGGVLEAAMYLLNLNCRDAGSMK